VIFFDVMGDFLDSKDWDFVREMRRACLLRRGHNK
jgi:hypothetical protein